MLIEETIREAREGALIELATEVLELAQQPLSEMTQKKMSALSGMIQNIASDHYVNAVLATERVIDAALYPGR